MKKIFLFLILFLSTKTFAQINDTVRLSRIKFCVLTIDSLKKQDPNIKEVKSVGPDVGIIMFDSPNNLYCEGIAQSNRGDKRIGCVSRIYKGVVFDKYQSDPSTITKIHLTREFKGYLPNETYLDLTNLKAKDIVLKYEHINSMSTTDSLVYWMININSSQSLCVYVKKDKNKESRNHNNEKYYLEKSIEGIDIANNCCVKRELIEPLYVLDGKVITPEEFRSLKPDEIESVKVLKAKDATDKYGDRAKYGVIETYLKKK